MEDEPKESIERAAIWVYQRKDDARKFRPLLVQQSMRGKVQNANFRGGGTESILAMAAKSIATCTGSTARRAIALWENAI